MIFFVGADCSFCISAKQLDTLKTRLENTNTQLEANNLQNLKGEQISGDLLTATIWSWFAAAESHNRLSQSQAGIIENPGLSYGLLHAVADPIYSWGVVRQVKFPGVNMDIGHVRNITWAKDNDEKKWVAYNRLRGQYMSALEHAVPERFFNDPAKCNAEGTTPPVLGLPVCPQGISAVKAIGLAASQGQKIYTITPEVYANNPNIVYSNLSAHSQSTKQGIQNALDAGMEVTVHDAPIAQSGWTGSGYTFIDPQTGAGGYIIDGGTNGSVLPNSPIDVVGRNSDTLAIILFGLGVIALAAKVTIIIGLLLAVTAFVIGSMAFMAAHLAALDYASNCPEALPCIEKIFMTVFLINTVLSLASLAINPAVAIAMAFSGLLFGDSLAQAAGMRCTNIACPRTT